MTVFKVLLLELATLLLDTTPRQWIYKSVALLIFVREEYFSTLESWVGWGVSFLAHGFLFLGLATGGVLKSIDGEEVLSVGELQPETATIEEIAAQLSEEELMELRGVYYVNQASKDEYEKRKELKKLLSQLKIRPGKRSAARSGLLSDTSGGGGQGGAAQRASQKMDWDKIIQAQKDKGKKVRSELIQHLGKYNNQMRKCYETALTKDPGLNTKVDVIFRVGARRQIQDVNLKYSGIVGGATKGMLSNCLSGVTQQILLPPSATTIAGQKVKFHVVLNSW